MAGPVAGPTEWTLGLMMPHNKEGADMEKKRIGGLLAVVGLLLLGTLAAPAWGAPTPVTACSVLGGPGSYILTADIAGTPGAVCLRINGNGATIDLNGHSIRGDVSGAVGTGSTGIGGSPANNVTIKGPGIIHDFDACISLATVPNSTTTPSTGGAFALVEDVLVYGCWSGIGIALGDGSKCVECRVHDARTGASIAVVPTSPPLGPPALPFTFVGGIGIIMGSGCLLESSIVEASDNGVTVGQDCKVWDLVIDGINHTGLRVGAGTTVARSVISHYHDGPGIDYRPCVIGLGCQDSSNSVFPGATGAPGAPTIVDTPGAAVITDCATNNSGVKYRPTFPLLQCP